MTTSTDAKPAPSAIPWAQFIAAMRKGREHVSDLCFSLPRASQVESSGQLVELRFQGLERLTPEAIDPQPLLQGISVYRLAASATAPRRQGTRRRSRDPEVHHAHPRRRREGGKRRQELVDVMTDDSREGMQQFDGELERLIRAGIVDLETGWSYASNSGNLRLALTDFLEEQAATLLAEPSAEKAEPK